MTSRTSDGRGLEALRNSRTFDTVFDGTTFNLIAAEYSQLEASDKEAIFHTFTITYANIDLYVIGGKRFVRCG